MTLKKILKDLLHPKPILYFVFIVSPWLFGAVEHWAKQFLFFCILLAFVMWTFQKKEENIRFFPGFIAGIVFLFYLFFQIIPLPPQVISFFSPKRLELAKTISSLTNFPQGIEFSSPLCLSLNPKESYFYLLEFSALALYAFLLYQLLSSKKEISTLILTMIVNGLALTLFGVIQRATFNGKLYWIRELTQGGDPFGPYVLRTHMGGLLLMIVPIGLGFLLSQYSFSFSKEEFFSFRANSDKDFFKKYLFLFFLLVISTGVLMSKSRGVIGSFLFSLFLMAIIITFNETKSKRLSFFLFAFIFSAVLFTLWLPSDLFLEATERIIKTPVNEEARGKIWEESLKLWKLFPLTGVGLGGFEDAFGLVRTVFPGPHRVAHAESDYMELLVEGGIVGVIPVMIFISTVIIANSFKLKTIDEKNKKLAIGALSSFFAGLFQGVANFNMSLMANMLYLVTTIVILSKVVELAQQKAVDSLQKKPMAEKILSRYFHGSVQ